MTYIGCAVGGDHSAAGSKVEALLVPVGAIEDGYLKMRFCERHLQDKGRLPDGDYYAILQVGYDTED